MRCATVRYGTVRQRCGPSQSLRLELRERHLSSLPEDLSVETEADLAKPCVVNNM